ncbi:hypothetical protein M5K25_001261 [Dendrobium thyrsiflorum]|uniref:RING-type domain-containing protein n=1 Tax=Dendrobium thyrsiflorum TaxID=117978 RepID=A0ABD0VQ41_DENTH
MPISSRALLQTAVAGPAASPAGDFFVAVAGASSFRKNSYSVVIMIIGVLFAAALCSVGLSYVVNLVLRPAASPAGDFFVAVAGASSFRKNSYSAVIMIMGVLFAAALCSVGLNYVVHWVLRYSSSRPDPPKRLQRAIRNLPGAGVYSAGLNLGDSGSDCAICLAKFEPGEPVRFLPKCGHCFHVGCVDRWLIIRPSCPTCRQCLVDCLC